MILNTIRHFNTIIKHKWYVFMYCLKSGIPFRGIVHDMSKFSPTEFFESAKYFKGTGSPITSAKKENGYSKAWLHHKGRNKHHWQYWYDTQTTDKTPLMPYKYTVEMICDGLAAGKVYQAKNWTNEYQLSYFEKESMDACMNKDIKNIVHEVYLQVAKNGISKTLNKNNLKNIYLKYTKKESIN